MELKQCRRQRQGWRPIKQGIIIHLWISPIIQICSVTLSQSDNLLKLNMLCSVEFQKIQKIRKISPPSFTFSKNTQYLVISRCCLQRTATKCTKTSKARAQLLFFSLNHLFSSVLVAAAVVVCLRSLYYKSCDNSKYHTLLRWLLIYFIIVTYIGTRTKLLFYIKHWSRDFYIKNLVIKFSLRHVI